ncbi:MAG: amidohydrolase family protein [Actinomycetota bacterium]|nr:amidohydrolase family protein [Actinomycetota bacterium]
MDFFNWLSPGPRFERTGADLADMVVADARIFTSDAARPRASAMAVRGGRIIYVGDDGGAAVHVGQDTRLIDGRKRVLTPGFIDNHCHVVWIGGMTAIMTPRLLEAANLEEMLEMVLDQSRANPDLPYVSGVGWRFEYAPGGAPDREVMDRVVKDRPVLLMSICGQCGWINTRAAELLEERNPQALGRLAPRLDASGACTGALDHFHSFSPLDFFSEEEIAPVFETAVPEAIAAVMDEAVSAGVTAMDDVQFYRPFVPYVIKYRESGIFDKVRLRGSLYVDPHDLEDEGRLRDDLAWWKDTAGESDERLTLGKSVKFYIDGTVGNRTSFFLEPYCDDPSYYGRPDWTQEDFDRVIEIADGMHLQTCTHAIGDAGIRRVIDSCERARGINGEWDSRHRLEHCEFPTPDDRERMARLGMHAAMQPTHSFGDEVVERFLGHERMQGWHPWRSLERAGVPLSFGSDWCNSPLNPFYGLLLATTRMNYKGKTDWAPEEKIAIENAVRHWTIDSARALKMEDDIGSLEVGKRADFVIWNTSPLKVNSWWFMLTHEMDLGKLEGFVDLTAVNGEVVYEKT